MIVHDRAPLIFIFFHGFCMLRQIGLHAFCQFAAGKQYAMPADCTFQADVRAETDHGPFIRSAGVRFPQSQVIFQL